MKKGIILITALFLAFSCGSVKPIAGLSLSEVNGKPATGMSYIDDTIAIDWSYTYRAKLNFKLKNNLKTSLRVLWDNAAYVNPDGSVDRVMHAGVKYVDRNESQPPSNLPAGTFLEDVIIPTSVIAFTPYVGWTEGSLLAVSYDPGTAEKQLANTYGKTIKVLLPVEAGGVVKEYDFTFTIVPLPK